MTEDNTALPATTGWPLSTDSSQLVRSDSVPAQNSVINVYAQHPLTPPIIVTTQGHGMLVRTTWYLFIGWWLSGIMMFLAGLCIMTVVGLPIGLALVNRLPGVLTLRPASQRLSAVLTSNGGMQYRLHGAQQRPMWQRAVYFVLVGWWAALLAMSLAWLLSVTIIGLPIGLMVLNRIPAVTTLRVN